MVDVAEFSGWQGHPESIQDGDQVDEFLGDRASDRGQVPRGGREHTHEAERHAADGALKGDTTEALADVDEFVDLLERSFQNDRAGGFGGDVAVLAKGDADRSGLHGGGVVDAVADENSWGQCGFRANNSDLLFRAFAVEHFGDADLGGEVADFGFAVSREEHDFRDAVAGFEMFDEGVGFGAGRVLEAQGGEELAVDEENGFHAGGGGREVGKVDLGATGDGDEQRADVAGEALAGLLADVEDGGEGDAFGFGGSDHRTGQGVL